MKKIKLTQNQYALVDDDDYEKLNQYNWFAHYESSIDCFYAERHSKRVNGRQPIQTMANSILDVPSGMVIDHISHNTLDNRKINLRVCTPQQNSMNRRKMKNTSSKYKGVSWIKNEKIWKASIRYNNEFIYLGRFTSEIEAAKAYDKKAKELFGKFAVLNFEEGTMKQ